jgi:16S rRNA (adenine1518-N6/adenine1519-N6)-dimethyltransferase
MASSGEYRLEYSIDLPPIDVPGLLRQHGLRPDKRLGQNFLIDPAALRRVVEAADINSHEVVLEIGAGLGSLTRYIASAARMVVAVELDSDLLPPLKQVLEPFENVRIVEGDILALNPAGLMEGLVQEDRGYLVAANIPYYITSALIRHLLESAPLPNRLVLTIQKEVASRIIALPGDMSLLALSVQVYGQPKVAATIPAGAFYPAPNVDSAVVRIDIYDEPVIPTPWLRSFFRLAKAGFSQKRKNLRNALSGGLGWTTGQVEDLLQKADIDPRRRAETLSLHEWNQLARLYQDASS